MFIELVELIHILIFNFTHILAELIQRVYFAELLFLLMILAMIYFGSGHKETKSLWNYIGWFKRCNELTELTLIESKVEMSWHIHKGEGCCLVYWLIDQLIYGYLLVWLLLLDCWECILIGVDILVEDWMFGDRFQMLCDCWLYFFFGEESRRKTCQIV